MASQPIRPKFEPPDKHKKVGEVTRLRKGLAATLMDSTAPKPVWTWW